MNTRAVAVLSACVVVGFMGVALTPPAHAQTSCFTFMGAIFDPSPPFDSEWSTPVMGVQHFTFNGDEHIVANIGNEMKIWELMGATSASSITTSGWHPTPVNTGGSVFHALRGVAVCDECRYGHAAFRELGQIVFDLGTGSSPSISFTYHGEGSGNSGLLGGAMYRNNATGQEYVICADLEGGMGTKIYEVHGTDLGSLTELASLTTASGVNYRVRRGEQYGHYMYLLPSSPPYSAMIVNMQDPSNPVAVEFDGVPSGRWTASVDKNQGYLALATGGTNPSVRIYDLTGDPMAPQQLGTISTTESVARVSVHYPYLFTSAGVTHKNVWDITIPSNPAVIDDDYWNNPDYDHNDGPGLDPIVPAFHSSGEGMFLAQYAELQVHKVECTSVQPMASYSLSPGSPFPGDTVTVTNTSTGPWTRSAIWVTDENQQIVAGSDQLLADTPSSRTFDIANDIGLEAAYTVHVAVESDEYPYQPGLPGDQLAEGAVTIDRTPQATFTISPEAPITGDTVTLDATPEGHPQGVGDEIPFEWSITPPSPADPFQQTDDPTDVTLDTSGTWTFDLMVDYMHTPPAGAGFDPDADGMYEAEAEQLEVTISSVAACFTVSPDNPLNTETITLNGSCSNYQDGADVMYDWEVDGPTYYDGCGNSQLCQIPADTLDPGNYSVSLTLTNTGNQDVSEDTQTVDVQDGTVQLEISGPSSRPVGQMAVFSLGGAPSGSSVTWNFGGPSCDGDPQQVTCTYPGDMFNPCEEMGYVYSTEGNKTVTASVSGVDSVQHQIEITEGSCGGECSYSVSPTSASYGQNGGNGSVSVQTDAGCSWSASPSQGWITITSGSSGTGSSTLSYQVAANTTGNTRYGSIYVEDATVSITQTAGSASLDFTFSPTDPEIGETVIFTLEGLSGGIDQAVWNFGGPGCTGYDQQTTCDAGGWTTCEEQSFKYASAGQKTVTVTVTISGSTQDPVTHTLTVQNSGSCDGGACNYSVNPMSVNAAAGGTSGTLHVNTTSNCDWTAESNTGWIHVTSGASGTGSGDVGFSVDANSDTTTRQGTLTVAEKSVTVYQEAASEPEEETGPMLIPAVASVPGLGGTSWKSDLRVFNPRTELLTIDIHYIPEPGDETPYPELTYHLDQDQTIWIEDIMYWFTQGDQAKGALIITYSPEEGRRPLVASRTFNDSVEGTYGQLIPVLGTSSLGSAGDCLFIPGVEHDAGYRTNIGLVNSGDVGTGVTVRAISQTGMVIAEKSHGVPAGRYMQMSLSTAIGDPDLSEFKGSVIVEVDNGGPLAAYASIVDQLSGDPIFINGLCR